jgi:hypothetical protein
MKKIVAILGKFLRKYPAIKGLSGDAIVLFGMIFFFKNVSLISLGILIFCLFFGVLLICSIDSKVKCD